MTQVANDVPGYLDHTFWQDPKCIEPRVEPRQAKLPISKEQICLTGKQIRTIEACAMNLNLSSHDLMAIFQHPELVRHAATLAKLRE